MFDEIKNKRVLITGGTGGIGSAIAELFSNHGARVGIHCRNAGKAARELLDRLKKNADAETFEGNLLESKTRQSLVKSFAKRFNGIDVLINNAGAVYDYEYFSKLDEKSWDDTIALNLKAPFYIMGRAFELMKEKGGGRIINISSASVKYGGGPRGFHYAAAKSALDTLTVGFAREGAKFNILVNSIRCGVIATDMHKKIKGYSEASFQSRVNLIPLKHPGKPIDIARMALFLASECGDFITGESFTVAGGD